MLDYTLFTKNNNRILKNFKEIIAIIRTTLTDSAMRTNQTFTCLYSTPSLYKFVIIMANLQFHLHSSLHFPTFPQHDYTYLECLHPIS